MIGVSTVAVAGYLQTDGVFTPYVAGQSSIDAAISQKSINDAAWSKWKSENAVNAEATASPTTSDDLAAIILAGAVANGDITLETKPTDSPVKPEETTND